MNTGEGLAPFSPLLALEDPQITTQRAATHQAPAMVQTAHCSHAVCSGPRAGSPGCLRSVQRPEQCEMLCRYERPGLVSSGAKFRVQTHNETGAWAMPIGRKGRNTKAINSEGVAWVILDI